MNLAISSQPKVIDSEDARETCGAATWENDPSFIFEGETGLGLGRPVTNCG